LNRSRQPESILHRDLVCCGGSLCEGISHDARINYSSRLDNLHHSVI